MPVINRIAEFHPELTAWRRDFHMHPELNFEEHRTAGIVAQTAARFRLRPGDRGLLRYRRDRPDPWCKAAPNGRAVGLRADMDALPIEELTGAAWASAKPRQDARLRP